MRTTVELSETTYRRLRSMAAEQGMRGFSSIIEEAVSLYLEGMREHTAITREVEAARGAWSGEDIADLEETLKHAWSSGWHIARS